MKKVFALIVALVLALGCVSFAEEAAAKKIVIGTNAEFAPFEYFNENGEIDGFDADLIELVMTYLGYEFEIISIDFDALLPALESGKIDLSIAAMTITEERLQNALFSDPYFNASQKIIVPADSAITSFAELAGKKIGVQLGTTGDLYVTENLEGATVERYNKALDAVIDLDAGRLDAVVTDAEPAKVYAAPYDNLKILDENVSEEMYGIAAALGNEALMAEVNEALAVIMDGGYYDDLYEMWFGEEEEEAEAVKVVIGTNAEFAPFEYFNENGEIDGFDADLIELIMTYNEYEFEIISIDFDALLPALASGKIDLSIAAMTITEERLENALFSDPYFNASQKIIVPADSSVTSFAELAGKKIGVQLGTTGDLYVTENLEGATVERYNKALDAVIDLAAGRLDAVVTDAEPAKVYAAPYENLKILDENVSEEFYGIAAALGSDALMADVNEALAYIMESGMYDALYEMWFAE